MKKISILFFVLIAQISIGQIKATTEDGKKVMLSENGTWEYEKTEVETKTDIVNSNTNCDEYSMTTVDNVTGESSTSSKGTIIISQDGGKKGFAIIALKSGKSLILSIKAVGAGSCIDDDDKMNILFRDGMRLELSNDAKFNCDANYTQYFGGAFGKKKQLEMLKTKEIEVMRIWTSKGFVEETLTKEQSNELMHTLRCLSE
jgi:hypothetical protein